MIKASMRRPTPYSHNSKVSATNISSKDGIRPLTGPGLMMRLSYMIWRGDINLSGVMCQRSVTMRP
jgi:hypothetical protein